MKQSIAVVGMASTGFAEPKSQSPIAMASDVVKAALEDAGLRRSQIDGLAVHIGSPRGTDYDLVASQLGLTVRFCAQPWSHGRFGATVITHAAMALDWGLADYVVCLAAYNNSRFGRHGMQGRPNYQESLREGGGPHAETPHVGLTAPVAGAAMAAQRYFHKYGVDPEKLAEIAVTFRRHAEANPHASMRKPLTKADYANARRIVEPLRLFDCSVIVDGAVALILTTADRARDLKGKPVHLLGVQGIHGGVNEFIFGQPGLGINQAEEFDYRAPGADQQVYRMAGVTPADIDTLHLYDAFSPQVLWTLERFGFCGVGEAVDFIQGGTIGLGGKLPVNTSGGFLSEGHLNGWGQMAEIVRQLRGEAGARQIAGVKLAQWATTVGDSLIFGTEARAH
jgi:acetyl-CoA acetyltransferase